MMKLIVPPLETIAGICGRQKLPDVPALRRTTLCVQVPCEQGMLLYHTLTGELVLLPGGEMTEEDRKELIAGRFLVPEDFRETDYVNEVLKVFRLMKHAGGRKTSFTVLTTTDCNARCFYCYEIGIRRYSMSRETAKAVAAYMIDESGGKPITISWFGGEPLYNREAIEIICDELKRQGVQFTSKMVSNGYYLDAETIRHARDDWHLQKVQITIDGTEETYNRTKAYIDPRGAESPFYRILNHIQLAADAGIRISIRLNMDMRNAADLSLLADQLAERFDGNPQIGVYPALLQEFAGKIHAYSSQQDTLRDFRAIEEKLEKQGLLKEEELFRTLRISRCMADNDSNEVILPDGRTGRCEHFSEEMITGDVHSRYRNEEVVRAWKEPMEAPECGDCALYPVCTRLKKCPWNSDGCPETERALSMDTLKRQVLRAYQQTRSKGENT